MDFFINLFNNLLTYPIFNVLMELYHWIGDFGLAIVTLTTLVFVITLPITWKQLKHAQAMLALQPELDEIKRRYTGDATGQLAGQRQLYKEHSISPTSTLGSTLVQGVVLTGLFFALNSVLRNATLATINRIMYPFFAHFTALPDLNLMWFTVFVSSWHISLSYPDPTHSLPLLTGLLTFIQMRMAQQPVDVMQARETMQQVLQFLMVLLSVGVTIFFAWQFGAGVALYRLVWLALSMIPRYLLTGWGALWTLPGLAVSDVGSGGSAIQMQVTGPRTISRTKSRRKDRGTSRRNGRHQKKR